MLYPTDTVLKSVMIAGIFGYLFCVGVNLKKRDLYLYPALEMMLLGVLNLLAWQLQILSLQVLLGLDLLGVLFVIQGIKEYREEYEGSVELRRFEKFRGILVRAVRDKQQVYLVLNDGSEHQLKPERLIKYGVEVAGLEMAEERSYRLENIQEIRVED